MPTIHVELARLCTDPFIQTIPWTQTSGELCDEIPRVCIEEPRKIALINFPCFAVRFVENTFRPSPKSRGVASINKGLNVLFRDRSQLNKPEFINVGHQRRVELSWLDERGVPSKA